MRILASAILAAAGTAFAAAPGSAQTYGNTDYPVCLQVFGRFSHYECSFTSIAQCNLSASGRSAQCITNPYYADARVAPRLRHHRRRHHVY